MHTAGLMRQRCTTALPPPLQALSQTDHTDWMVATIVFITWHYVLMAALVAAYLKRTTTKVNVLEEAGGPGAGAGAAAGGGSGGVGGGAGAGAAGGGGGDQAGGVGAAGVAGGGGGGTVAVSGFARWRWLLFVPVAVPGVAALDVCMVGGAGWGGVGQQGDALQQV